MSTLIPNVLWEERQKDDVYGYEVFDGDIENDENYLGTWIPKNNRDPLIAMSIRIRAEALAQTNNSVALPKEDKTPFQEAVEIVNSLACPDCSFISKSRFGLQAHRRKHSREKVKV